MADAVTVIERVSSIKPNTDEIKEDASESKMTEETTTGTSASEGSSIASDDGGEKATEVKDLFEVDAFKEATEIDSEPFSVCIVGAGAIGCHLAYTLQKSGAKVTLIARGENLRALRTDGLHITICGEKIGPVFIPATDTPESVGHVDYVFLTMKVSGYDSEIVKTISPLMGPSTTILPPTTSIPYWWFYKFGGDLSGRRLERVDPGDTLWSALPPGQVVGFTMWLSAVRLGPGRTALVHVQRGYPLGELDGTRSHRVQRLANALEKGGVPAPQVSNIRSEIFIKSINSLAFNVVAVLGDAVNGTIGEVPEAVDTLRTVMAECEGMAHAMGIPIHQSAENRIRQTLSAHMHTMSMLHDLRSGRKLELRPLWESICDLADILNVSLPVTKALVSCALLREKAENVRRQSTDTARPHEKRCRSRSCRKKHE
jgi:2-dehydropantoate 2-reductase